MVHQLSKKEASRHAIMNSQPMMSTIIQVLSMTNDIETQRFLAGTLHNVSYHRQGLVGIFRSGGIPVLVRLLRSSLEPLLFFAVTTLHNLLQHQDGAKKAVRDANGIPEMVRLLGHPNVKFLAITTDCLQTLSYGNQESKLMLLSTGAPRELVRIMATCNYEKLLWTTCRLLKVLSVCPSNKPMLVECGALQALGQLLTPSQSSRLVLNCLWTIRNLSDAATRLEGIDQLLATFVKLLHQSVQLLASQPAGSQLQTLQNGSAGQQLDHAQVISCICGILSNLTCNNTRTKLVLTRNGGLHLLVRALLVCVQVGCDRDDILEPAICAMRHLTAKHAEAETAYNVVREENGIPLLVRLLASPPLTASNTSLNNAGASLKWPLQKALASLMRNLSLSPSNSSTLRECGAIRKLIDLLSVTYQFIRARQSASQSSLTSPMTGATVLDGVRLEEVLEHACSALHVLARDPANRSAIAALNCVPLFVQLLYVTAEPVQRSACGLLFELAADREQALFIDQVSGEAPLTELLHSRSEPVQQLAANVLMRLAAYKPPEYQARLRIELQNSVGSRPTGAAIGSQQQLNAYAVPNQFSSPSLAMQQNGNPYAVQNTMSGSIAPQFGNQHNQFPLGSQMSMHSPAPPAYSNAQNELPWNDVAMPSDDQMYMGEMDQPLGPNNVDYLASQVNMMHPFAAGAYNAVGSGVRTPASGAMTPITPPTGTRTPAEYFHSDL